MKKAETANSGAAPKKKSEGFTAEEMAAMKDRAKELKAEAKAQQDREAGEADLQAKIAEMSEPSRSMAARLHAIITATAPDLMPKTWYGQPAYAKDGKIICFFQSMDKFGAHYATLGFNDAAHLDEGGMWPVYYALTQLTATEEKRIVALIRKAVS